MNYFLMFLLLISFFTTSLVYAQTPEVHRNMQVIQGGNPSRCDASWNGRGGQEDVTRYGIDQGNGLSGPVIRSCVGCAMTQITSQSQACVCKTCYDYYQ